MATIHLVSLAYPDPGHLQELAQGVAMETGWAVLPLASGMAIDYAYDSVRRQHHSSRILLGLKNLVPDGDRILGVTCVDLFIPILTFVFGEAQLNGPTAVVSSFRLNPELYGLAPDDRLSMQRLLKESIHELGHTFGLRHCIDFECVMHASTYAEEIDLKQKHFCRQCKDLVMKKTIGPKPVNL
jgi:archaemetzincin